MSTLPKRITICNIYFPPNLQFDIEELNNLIPQLPKPFILLGDFNSHNKIWGSNFTSTKGMIIERFLDSNLINILNSNKPTRYNSYNGTFSNIDLTFSSPDIALMLEWEVLEDLYDSDHFPIHITLNTEKNHHPMQSKWKIKSANWDLFRELTEISEPFPSPEPTNIDLVVDLLSKKIYNAANLAVGKTKPNSTRKVPWMTDECKQALKLTKSALNYYRRHKTIINHIIFKKLRASSRRIIKEAKRVSWENYVSTISTSTPTKEIWNKIRSLQGQNSNFKINAIKSYDNILYHNTKDIVNVLAKNFEGVSSDENLDENFLNIKNATERIEYPVNNNPSSMDSPISRIEFESALNSTKILSAPGPDDILYIFIKNLPDSFINNLLLVYNCIWTQRCFPKTLQNVIITPIKKPNKDPTDPNSYRPISLSCTLCKLLEKIICRRLSWTLETKNFLSPNQAGFRPNYSTIDHLLNLESEIHNAYVNMENLVAVFLDIQKAFDLTWRHLPVKKLIELNIHGNIVSFIQNILQNRTF